MLPGKQPSLRPLDAVVALHLVLNPEDRYEHMSEVLDIGLGSGHRAVQRAVAAGLVLPHRRAASPGALTEFLEHGIRFAFYPVTGPEAQGVPTAHSGPLMAKEIVSDRAVVWPSADGRVRGDSLVPLYDGAPGLVSRSPRLYELLTLVDAVRVGRARERRIAIKLLHQKLRAESTA
jgi:hypothetical protein